MTELTRRDFLQTATTAPLAFGIPRTSQKSCILLVLTGGPSHVDTWDPKPDAPSEIRSPFRPIRTNVPGIQISGIFPRMAMYADKYALIRSVYSDAAPTHEDGLSLIDAATTHAVTLHPGPRPTPFSENCRRALQLVEAGTPFVRVNMFDSVFHQPGWDNHGTRPFSTFRDYKKIVGPLFDLAYRDLLLNLSECGLLESTLVVATGEFGRTPRINPSGGRDHWTKCWTVLMAGGGIQGGQVYGSSDATGAEPKDNPVHFTRIMATMQATLGQSTTAEPLRELFS